MKPLPVCALLALSGALAQAPDPEAWGPLQPPAQAAPISLDVQQADVGGLMQVFAQHSGLNFVLGEGVGGPLTLRLRELPWPQALDVVLRAKGLAARQQGRVVWVAPQESWAQRERKQLEAQQALDGLSPLRTQAWRLQYTRATEVAQRLLGQSLSAPATGSAAGGGRWLSARGTVLAEPRTNQLFVSDLPARLAEVQAVIERLDVPVRQVQIEARIVEADDQFGQSLGVRWGLGLQRQAGGQALGQIGARSATAGPGTTPGPSVDWPAGQAGQSVLPAASLAVSLFDASARRHLNVELSALEAEGRGRVVSRPRVITADQSKALIEQGTELPYQTLATTGNSTIASVSFRRANLKLEVTPQITPEGAVVLDVDVHRDSIGQLTSMGYAINTKHVKTSVRVADGGTVVLGGIFEDTDKNDQDRLPGLAGVPLLGALFGQRQQVRRRSELLVFLTPQILAEPAPTSASPLAP